MPIVKRQIKEQHKSIIRPVVIDVVNDLIRFMELKPNTDIIFKGYSEIALMPNGIIGIKTDNENKENIRTVGRERIFIEIEEEDTETSHLEMPVTYPEQRFIFADQDTGIFVRPIKKRVAVRVSFNNRFTSKAAADAWKGNMEALLAQYVKDYVHEVKYNYAYPDEVLHLLHELWKYREYQGGYGQTFSTWFRGFSTNKLTAIANQDGKQTDLVIAETADNVQGNWEFDSTPFPTKANSLGNWQAEFNYRFEFDKPIALDIQYPIIIHNRVLTEDMIPRRRQPSYRGKAYAKPLQQTRFEGIQVDLGETQQDDLTAWLRYPEFDEWQLPQFDFKFLPQYQALLALEPTSLQSIVKLTELGPYQFTPRTLAYLRHVGARCLHHRQSIIQITIWQDDDMLDPNDLTFDPRTFEIKAIRDLDIRKTYRLVVYIDSDLRRLWELAVTELKERGVWTQEVISVIFSDKAPAIDGDGRVQPIPPVNDEGCIEDEDWRNLIDGIDWSKLPSTDTLYTGRFVIIARSERDGYR